MIPSRPTIFILPWSLTRGKVASGTETGRPTAGLNSPPLILKNTPAITAREKPKLSAIYDNVDVLLIAPTLFGVGGLLR